jgi:hypothetical protein
LGRFGNLVHRALQTKELETTGFHGTRHGRLVVVLPGERVLLLAAVGR